MPIELSCDNRAPLRRLFDRYPCFRGFQTHDGFRRRGLARAVAAAMVLYCLDRGLEPCWDAANEPSSALARQLGFRSMGKYEALNLPDDGSAAG
ncbi:MAG: GNAT family N-acetyltransferase [Cyanosarcina radialis HA8281-LM2]|jgi:predicted GNAT family acetyltransferase|nr:GNAT family N-acetyltransferase [Cyanosarcina radialis HA8281-LM2]